MKINFKKLYFFFFFFLLFLVIVESQTPRVTPIEDRLGEEGDIDIDDKFNLTVNFLIYSVIIIGGLLIFSFILVTIVFLSWFVIILIQSSRKFEWSVFSNFWVVFFIALEYYKSILFLFILYPFRVVALIFAAFRALLFEWRLLLGFFIIWIVVILFSSYHQRIFQLIDNVYRCVIHTLYESTFKFLFDSIRVYFETGVCSWNAYWIIMRSLLRESLDIWVSCGNWSETGLLGLETTLEFNNATVLFLVDILNSEYSLNKTLNKLGQFVFSFAEKINCLCNDVAFITDCLLQPFTFDNLHFALDRTVNALLYLFIKCPLTALVNTERVSFDLFFDTLCQALDFTGKFLNDVIQMILDKVIGDIDPPPVFCIITDFLCAIVKLFKMAIDAVIHIDELFVSVNDFIDDRLDYTEVLIELDKWTLCIRELIGAIEEDFGCLVAQYFRIFISIIDITVDFWKHIFRLFTPTPATGYLANKNFNPPFNETAVFLECLGGFIGNIYEPLGCSTEHSLKVILELLNVTVNATFHSFQIFLPGNDSWLVKLNFDPIFIESEITAVCLGDLFRELIPLSSNTSCTTILNNLLTETDIFGVWLCCFGSTIEFFLKTLISIIENIITFLQSFVKFGVTSPTQIDIGDWDLSLTNFNETLRFITCQVSLISHNAKCPLTAPLIRVLIFDSITALIDLLLSPLKILINVISTFETLPPSQLNLEEDIFDPIWFPFLALIRVFADISGCFTGLDISDFIEPILSILTELKEIFFDFALDVMKVIVAFIELLVEFFKFLTDSGDIEDVATAAVDFFELIIEIIGQLVETGFEAAFEAIFGFTTDFLKSFVVAVANRLAEITKLIDIIEDVLEDFGILKRNLPDKNRNEKNIEKRNIIGAYSDITTTEKGKLNNEINKNFNDKNALSNYVKYNYNIGNYSIKRGGDINESFVYFHDMNPNLLYSNPFKYNYDPMIIKLKQYIRFLAEKNLTIIHEWNSTLFKEHVGDIISGSMNLPISEEHQYVIMKIISDSFVGSTECDVFMSSVKNSTFDSLIRSDKLTFLQCFMKRSKSGILDYSLNLDLLKLKENNRNISWLENINHIASDYDLFYNPEKWAQIAVDFTTARKINSLYDIEKLFHFNYDVHPTELLDSLLKSELIDSNKKNKTECIVNETIDNILDIQNFKSQIGFLMYARYKLKPNVITTVLSNIYNYSQFSIFKRRFENRTLYERLSNIGDKLKNLMLLFINDTNQNSTNQNSTNQTDPSFETQRINKRNLLSDGENTFYSSSFSSSPSHFSYNDAYEKLKEKSEYSKSGKILFLKVNNTLHIIKNYTKSLTEFNISKVLDNVYEKIKEFIQPKTQEAIENRKKLYRIYRRISYLFSTKAKRLKFLKNKQKTFQKQNNKKFSENENYNQSEIESFTTKRSLFTHVQVIDPPDCLSDLDCTDCSLLDRLTNTVVEQVNHCVDALVHGVSDFNAITIPIPSPTPSLPLNTTITVSNVSMFILTDDEFNSLNRLTITNSLSYFFAIIGSSLLESIEDLGNFVLNQNLDMDDGDVGLIFYLQSLVSCNFDKTLRCEIGLGLEDGLIIGIVVFLGLNVILILTTTVVPIMIIDTFLIFMLLPFIVLAFSYGYSPFCYPTIPECLVRDINNITDIILSNQCIFWPEGLLQPDQLIGENCTACNNPLAILNAEDTRNFTHCVEEALFFDVVDNIAFSILWLSEDVYNNLVENTFLSTNLPYIHDAFIRHQNDLNDDIFPRQKVCYFITLGHIVPGISYLILLYAWPVFLISIFTLLFYTFIIIWLQAIALIFKCSGDVAMAYDT